MTFEELERRIKSCNNDQVKHFKKGLCYCKSNKPKLFIPKDANGLYLYCGSCTIKSVIERELTVQEYFVVNIL